MIKLIVNAGAYVLEFTDTDLGEISEHLEKCKEELPGFSLEKYSEKPVKSVVPKKQTADMTTEEDQNTVPTEEDLIQWIQGEIPNHHSMNYIKKESGFAPSMVGRLLKRMQAAGKIDTASTPYVNTKSGHTGYMMAYYLPGDAYPEDWPDDPARDADLVLAWVTDNNHTAYTPSFVEKSCGVPPKQAVKGLKALRDLGRVKLLKDPRDGNGKIHLAVSTENNGKE